MQLLWEGCNHSCRWDSIRNIHACLMSLLFFSSNRMASQSAVPWSGPSMIHISIFHVGSPMQASPSGLPNNSFRQWYRLQQSRLRRQRELRLHVQGWVESSIWKESWDPCRTRVMWLARKFKSLGNLNRSPINNITVRLNWLLFSDRDLDAASKALGSNRCSFPDPSSAKCRNWTVYRAPLKLQMSVKIYISMSFASVDW